VAGGGVDVEGLAIQVGGEPASQLVYGEQCVPVDLVPVTGVPGDEGEVPAFLAGLLALPDPGQAADVIVLAVLVVSLGYQAIAPAEAEMGIVEAAELGADAVFQPCPRTRVRPLVLRVRAGHTRGTASADIDVAAGACRA
jgi:hypothetical protein